MAYNQQLSVFSQVAPATTGTAGQVLVSAGSSANSYWAATIPVSAYSAQFNGSSQYLTIPSSASVTSNFTFGSSDFTIESWIYPTTGYSGGDIFGKRANGSVYSGINLGIASSSGLKATIIGSTTGSSWDVTYTVGSINIPFNAWTHIALARNGSNFRVFVNGVLDFTVTNSGALYTESSNAVAIGSSTADGSSKFQGYLSNYRIVKGVAVYTGAFTVPTSPLGTSQAAGTNISAVTPSQVSLLTCNGTGFTDSSPNAFAITNNGNAVTSQFAPFSSFSAIARSATQTQTILTSGSGTYYTPSGVAWLRVRMVGGGGGGSGSNAGNWGGSGGGSGAYLEAAIVSPAASYAYSIGAGGGGGAAVSSGSAGANTTFGSLNCGGGLAGLYGSFNTGTAPTASGGQINVSGIAGGGGTYGTVQAIAGVSGASSPFSAGGAGSNPSGSTNPGLAGAYGSGGGGAGQTPSGSSGGSGGSGIIIVEENYAVNTSSGGGVLQVQSNYYTSATQLTSSGAMHELTSNLRVSITPKSATSTIVIEVYATFVSPGSNNLEYAAIYDVTNSAYVNLPPANGSRIRAHWAKRTTAFDANDFDTLNFTISVPNTSTATRTYTLYHSTEGSVIQFLSSTLSTASGATYPLFMRVWEIAP